MKKDEAELWRLLDEIGTQRCMIQAEARLREVSPFSLRSTDGGYLMLPLLVAEANVRLALSNIGG